MPAFYIVLALALLAVVLFAWILHQAREVLQRWADANGYELIYREPKVLFKGPLTDWSRALHMAYRVEVRDREDRRRWGWVSCGAWLTDVPAEKVEVVWDEEPPRTHA